MCLILGSTCCLNEQTRVVVLKFRALSRQRIFCARATFTFSNAFLNKCKVSCFLLSQNSHKQISETNTLSKHAFTLLPMFRYNCYAPHLHAHQIAVILCATILYYLHFNIVCTNICFSASMLRVVTFANKNAIFRKASKFFAC